MPLKMRYPCMATNFSANDLPILSVITVVLNDEKGLQRTINSVFGQSYPNIEYIIIDGGSTDETINIIRQNNSNIAKWISEPDTGIYDAMNKGITFAKGDWILFLNSGHTFCNKKVITEILKNNKYDKYGILYGDMIYEMKFGNVVKRGADISKIQRFSSFE